VFQDSVVDQPLTGRRNLEIHARLWGVEAAEVRRRIADVADAFGLTDLLDRAVASYSGGQRRRLEIARALLSRPQVLFLDEPTVGLDPRIRFELLDIVAGLRDHAELTILLTTHYLDEAERLCDRIAIVHQGRIVALDTPAALLATLGQEIVELRVGGDPQAALALPRSSGIGGADAFAVGATLTVPLHERAPGRAIPAITELGLTTTSISTRPPTLDDVYRPGPAVRPQRTAWVTPVCAVHQRRWARRSRAGRRLLFSRREPEPRTGGPGCRRPTTNGVRRPSAGTKHAATGRRCHGRRTGWHGESTARWKLVTGTRGPSLRSAACRRRISTSGWPRGTRPCGRSCSIRLLWTRP